MNEKKIKTTKLFKKEVRQKVYDKLVVALAEFKTGMKDKKFEKKLRKTSKLFAVDIAKIDDPNKVKTRKLVKQITKEVVENPMQKASFVDINNNGV